MHDVSRAQTIVRIVLEAAKQQDANTILEIDLVIGRLTMLTPVQLEFWIQEFLKDTIGEGAEITIEQSDPRVHCKECGYEGAVTVTDDPIYHLMPFTPACPDCDSTNLQIQAGDECTVTNMRINR